MKTSLRLRCLPLILLGLAVFCGSRAVAQPNLVLNGDFSGGTNGWTLAVFDPQNSSVTFNTGGGFANVSIGIMSTSCFLSQEIPTMPGVFYRVSFVYLMNAEGPQYITSTPVSFAGSPLNFAYTNINTYQTNCFIIEATHTNSLLQFGFDTASQWNQEVGYISVTPVTNLVVNGDFSNGTNAWTFSYDPEDGGAGITPGQPAAGFANVIGNTTCILSQEIPTMPGAFYKVSFQYYMNAEYPQYAHSILATFGASPLNFSYSTIQTVVTNCYLVQATQTNSLFQFNLDPQISQWDEAVGNISAIPVSSPLNFHGGINGNNRLNLSSIGTPGIPYILQSATNLASPVNWQNTWTNCAATNGMCTYTVTNPVAPGFYRIILR